MLYSVFMDLEKAYDRVDRGALWSVMKINCVGRHLLKGSSSSSISYRRHNGVVIATTYERGYRPFTERQMHV